MSNKTAIITGCDGQDGYYLTDFLLKKGYTIIGITNNFYFKDNIVNKKLIHPIDPNNIFIIDVRDHKAIQKIVKIYQPDEYYNLAGISITEGSWEKEYDSYQINFIGAINALQAINNENSICKLFQASSSELFGDVNKSVQNEETYFNPRSPYGISKLAAYWAVINYRKRYKLHGSNGIMYNHESELRPEHFVTRKITKAVAAIYEGSQNELFLGNLSAKRDWGYAPDYVEAMWMMLQQDNPDDYIVSTGVTHSVKEFCEIAFRHVGLDYKNYVKESPEFYRPTEKYELKGDNTKIQKQLNWKPKTSFKELVHRMVDSDMKLLTTTQL